MFWIIDVYQYDSLDIQEIIFTEYVAFKFTIIIKQIKNKNLQ